MIKTFEDWLNGMEGFALRSERAYDDLTSIPKDTVDHWRNIVIPWLRGAFDAGYEAGEFNKERSKLIDKDYPPGYKQSFTD